MQATFVDLLNILKALNQENSPPPQFMHTFILQIMINSIDDSIIFYIDCKWWRREWKSYIEGEKAKDHIYMKKTTSF